LDAHLSAKGDASASTSERRVRQSRGRGESTADGSTAVLRGGGTSALACGDGGERVSMRYCWRGERKMGESAVEAGVHGVGEHRGVRGPPACHPADVADVRPPRGGRGLREVGTWARARGRGRGGAARPS
jgi:hypothetical protein